MDGRPKVLGNASRFDGVGNMGWHSGATAVQVGEQAVHDADARTFGERFELRPGSAVTMVATWK